MLFGIWLLGLVDGLVDGLVLDVRLVMVVLGAVVVVVKVLTVAVVSVSPLDLQEKRQKMR